MEFGYRSTLAGVLKYMHYMDENYFKTQIKFIYSNVWAGSGVSHTAPLDPDDSGYWISDGNKVKDHFYGFCFLNATIKLTSYEMKTTSGTNKPVRWYFSGSNDGKSWKYKTEYRHKYSDNEVKRFEWKHEPYKCFMINCLESTRSGSS